METVVACTAMDEPLAAGHDLATQILSSLGDADAIIVFASPKYDHSLLLTALRDKCERGVIVGSSSAGEFASAHRGEGACDRAGASHLNDWSQIRGPLQMLSVAISASLTLMPLT